MKQKLKKFEEFNLYASMRKITQLEKKLFKINNALLTAQVETETSSSQGF